MQDTDTRDESQKIKSERDLYRKENELLREKISKLNVKLDVYIDLVDNLIDRLERN